MWMNVDVVRARRTRLIGLGAGVIAGLVLYVLGAYVITFAVNVPMNDALEAGKGSAASLRETFEDKWTMWNHARSLLTTGGFVCLIVGVLKV